jgi:HK97 family phage major capsid protein
MELDAIATRIDELEKKAAGLVEAATAKDGNEGVSDAKALIEKEIRPELDSLLVERDARIREVEFKSLKGEVQTLESVIADLRKGFPVSADGTKSITSDETNPYATGEFSYYADIKAANRGRSSAIERLAQGAGVSEEGVKALVEGTGSQGGYLVQTQIERQIIDVRELDNVLRPLCSALNVTTTSIELDQITLGTTAGWAAELATKPEATSLTLATVSASIFTAAGLATISNALLADSNPAVDQLVTRDLSKRLVALEETAFLNGSGTGQPLGILNTPGLQTVTQTVAGSSAAGGILDSILTGIANVQTNYGSPSAILMHPRTWTVILKDKDSTGVYTYGSPADARTSSPQFQQGRTVYGGPDRTLWGVPVILSNRIPTNLGTGTNESRIIIADFSEALILDRQGITIDESPHVYFTSNQTVFRAEERVGFTAARQPNAFCVVGGSGLANS